MCAIGQHDWVYYYFNCHRSCNRCSIIQVAGYTNDDDDWHKPNSWDIKKALQHFLTQLGVRGEN